MGTAVLIHLLRQELIHFVASIFRHLRPILYLVYRSKCKGHPVIEDLVDRGHCQRDAGSNKQPAVIDDSTYALYSGIMG